MFECYLDDLLRNWVYFVIFVLNNLIINFLQLYKIRISIYRKMHMIEEAQKKIYIIIN